MKFSWKIPLSKNQKRMTYFFTHKNKFKVGDIHFDTGPMNSESKPQITNGVRIGQSIYFMEKDKESDTWTIYSFFASSKVTHASLSVTDPSEANQKFFDWISDGVHRDYELEKKCQWKIE